MAQESQLDEKTLKSLMPAIDINELHLTQNQVLIFHEDQNKESLGKTEGGVLISENATAKAKMGMLTHGTIIKIGPKTEDPEIAVGKQAMFFRHESEGGIKGTDGLIYVIFREYNIKGIFPTPVPVVTPEGDIQNLN